MRNGHLDVTKHSAWCLFKVALALWIGTMVGLTPTTAGTLERNPVYRDGQVSGHVFDFKGPIVKGDAARLAAFISRHAGTIEALNLDSPGGDVSEAVLMGEIIRAARLDAYVQPGRRCASACFFLWINGADRLAWGISDRTLPSGKPWLGNVGLHRPYLAEIQNTSTSVDEQGKVMRFVGEYLHRKMVPRRLIDLMMSRSSKEIYWLTDEDIAELGKSPPDLDELYIAKCRGNRKALEQQIHLARQNRNSELEGLLNESYADINRCIGDLNFEARRSALSNGFGNLLKKAP